jgi:hypothetical protein
MSCATCDALRHDHNRECGVEAEAALALRRRIMNDPLAHPEAPDSVLEDAILASRKKQLEIVFRLHEHKSMAHAA